MDLFFRKSAQANRQQVKAFQTAYVNGLHVIFGGHGMEGDGHICHLDLPQIRDWVPGLILSSGLRSWNTILQHIERACLFHGLMSPPVPVTVPVPEPSKLECDFSFLSDPQQLRTGGR